MITLNDISNVLSSPLFTLADQQITLGGLLLIPVLIFLGHWVTKFLIKLVIRKLIRQEIDPNIIHLTQRVLYVVAISIVIMTILALIDIPITAFAFLSGAIAIGLGFGAQNIINNFISGWILMWEKPIRIGDFLEVENAVGVVEKINTRSTRFRRIDGVHLLIPNSKLLENTVVNWTLVDTLMRTTVKVGVAYGSPAKKVAELILQATQEQDAVINDPKIEVIFDDFGDNALIFEVYFWVRSDVDIGWRAVRSNIRFRLDELFTEHNIVVAFPQRDVHIDGNITLINNKEQ